MHLKSNHFTIVILSYNNEDWVKKNLSSAINQDYDNYDIVYVEDASTDNTLNKVKEYQKQWSHKKGIFKLICNKENVRALPNLYQAVDCAKNGSIIVALDGDDWLVNDQVLNKLNLIYQNENTWITAGSYLIKHWDQIQIFCLGIAVLVDCISQGRILLRKTKIHHTVVIYFDLFGYQVSTTLQQIYFDADLVLLHDD